MPALGGHEAVALARAAGALRAVTPRLACTTGPRRPNGKNELQATDSGPAFLAGGGEMGGLIRAHDWAATPLGPPAGWPQVLQTLTALMLSSSQPMFVVWGPQRTTIYNDAYAEILAGKHPALGEPFEAIWHEIWDRDLKPIVERAYAGEALHMDDIPLLMLRKGYPEETHFSFSYTPVRDASGAVQGFFCPCLEITEQVLEQRRARLRTELTERLRSSGDPAALASDAAGLLGRHLQAEQAAYAEVDESGEHALVARDWNDGRMASNAGRHRLQDFGAALVAELEAGRSVAIGDVREDPRTATPEALESFAKRGIRAVLSIPHIRHGRLAAILAVHAGAPRRWHPADVALAEEVVERVNVASERFRAEAARCRSEARLRKVLEIETAGVVFFDLVGGIFDANDAFLATVGYSRAELEAGEVRYENLTPPDWRWRDEKTIAELKARGKAGPFEKEYTRKDGSRIWILCADKMLDERTAVELVIDVTERKRAEQALGESEARFRALVSSTSNMLYRMGPDWTEMRQLDGRGFILDTVEPRRNWMADYIDPEDQPEVAAAVREAVRSKSTFDLEHRVRRLDGSLGWVHSRAVPLLDDAGEIVEWFGAATDVTDRKLAEQHQAMLMAELDHRVKNVLAVVQAIARQSLRSEDLAGSDAAERLLGRLSALAQSHTILASGRWEGASLRNLLENALAPYRGEGATRVGVAGPDLQVTPRAAQTLTLALHELVTNAAKYGALSRGEGEVAAEWELRGAGEDARLVFRWTERGGPPVKGPPARKGFGSRLIERTLAFELDGEVTLDFARSGLRGIFELPLRNLRVRYPRRPGSLQRGDAPAPGNPTALAGKRVLVVEDEHLVANEVVEALAAAGCLAVGPAPSLGRALRAAETEQLDAAVLDVNLHGDLVWPAAKLLRERGIPFVFTTGYSGTIAPPPELADSPWLEKPLRPERVTSVLAALVTKR